MGMHFDTILVNKSVIQTRVHRCIEPYAGLRVENIQA